MGIMDIQHLDVEIRSYDATRLSDRHDFAQLVLPVSGMVQLEVEGKHRVLDAALGAVVMAGAWHSQCSDLTNSSIILDIDEAALTHEPWQRLTSKPFTEISPAARKLIEFMQLSIDDLNTKPALLRSWVGLLLDTLAMDAPAVKSRLAVLLARVEADPGLPWTTESMARYAGVSVSRLHALFREELESSPGAWVLRARIELACQLLAHTHKTLAEVALLSGFSDQTALTRALRNKLDITPAAYRRSRQENGSKKM